jgi:two-component system, OmpR family, response regulator VicR
MKILIIEDDIMLLKTLDFKLKREGYEVSISKNGMEAIESLKLTQPDMIVTDIMMPFTNGLEVVSFVRNEIFSQIPIIVLSSAKHQNVVLEALSLGANDFLAKPFNPDELILRIKKLNMHTFA